MIFKVTENFDGCSVRDFLKIGKGLSSRLFSCLKRENAIRRGGDPVLPFEKVSCGDEIELVFPESESGVLPQKGKLDILFEDDCILAVNKPALMPCHPSVGHYRDTLANYVAGYFHENGLKTAVRIPARIDSGTTGVVLIAKNEYVAERLSAQKMNKTYICVCEGSLPKEGEIDLPIGRSRGSIIRREVRADGKPAKTFFKKTGQGTRWSAAQVRLETGRTHQIRVHFAHMGHPLLGDWLYGRECAELSRHLLHLERVEAIHPVTEERIVLTAPIPKDMEKFFRNVKPLDINLQK